jgi:hypothetical protein
MSSLTEQDALAFAGSNIGWCGNGTGQVYRTTDLGDHWRLEWGVIIFRN